MSKAGEVTLKERKDLIVIPTAQLTQAKLPPCHPSQNKGEKILAK